MWSLWLWVKTIVFERTCTFIWGSMALNYFNQDNQDWSGPCLEEQSFNQTLQILCLCFAKTLFMIFVRSAFENAWTPCQLAPWGSSLVLVFSKHLSQSRQGYEKLGEVEEEQDTTLPFATLCYCSFLSPFFAEKQWSNLIPRCGEGWCATRCNRNSHESLEGGKDSSARHS